MEAEIDETGGKFAKAGMEIYLYMVLPFLKPEDRHKYVALDVNSAFYEVDDDSSLACERLTARRSHCRIWIEHVGDPVATRREYQERIAVIAKNATKRRPGTDWSAKGQTIYRDQILPLMKFGDRNKYVAIDIDSGEFEVDPVSIEACVRLKARRPESRIWMERVGHPTACRMPRLRRIDWI